MEEQIGLTQRITLLMTITPGRAWKAREVAQVLGEGTRICRERMKASPRIERLGEGRYRLVDRSAEAAIQAVINMKRAQLGIAK
jgi:CelD/BcsL family acetyltransferase involved in cellulose biosynthesis